jgi:drug/metabolite transporter (DMT)-like permease
VIRKRPIYPTVLCTVLAMIAFAANSLLCRLALGAGAIDAAGFTAVRIASGALLLVPLARASRRTGRRGPGGAWTSAALLFLYAAGFSFAYVTLPVGTGALILFAAVQTTMIAAGLRSGERPAPLEWAGLVLALGGLVWLTAPGITAPSPAGSALMAAAGIAWGVYSVRGRGTTDPLGDTAGSFLRAVPMALAVSLVSARAFHAAPRGLLLAVISGAIASGLGYVLWYAALRGLTATRAATVQLAVPVLTAAGGVTILGERITGRLIVAAILILGGIALAVLEHGRRRVAAR